MGLNHRIIYNTVELVPSGRPPRFTHPCDLHGIGPGATLLQPRVVSVTPIT